MMNKMRKFTLNIDTTVMTIKEFNALCAFVGDVDTVGVILPDKPITLQGDLKSLTGLARINYRDLVKMKHIKRLAIIK